MTVDKIRLKMDTQPLIEYLQAEMGIEPAAIAIATRKQRASQIELPILLWQNGLIDLQQLNAIFDWKDNQPS